MVRGHTPPPEPATAIGSPRRLGRYALLESFAVGGTSELYVALRDGAQDICLLKVLSTQLKADSRAHQRLQREASVAFRLFHPNFTRVLSAGDEGGRFTVAIEFIAGQSLAAVMARVVESGAQVPLDVAISMVLQVLEGLEYLHTMKGDEGEPLGLVHRDLTVANVILGFDGDVKIIDLGAMHGQLDDFKTAPGVVLGTPQAMAPEQAMGGTIDRRTDVYAAGFLLYQLLTATMPFQGAKLLDTLEQVRSKIPPLASELRPEVPRAMAEVIARAIAKDPAARYPSALELRAALVAARGPKPATKEALAAFLQQLAPDEAKRIAGLVELGKNFVREQADFETEESLAQGAFTKAGVPLPGTESFGDESSVRTAIVRTRSTAGEDAGPLAAVIPLPRRAKTDGKIALDSSPAHTPSGVMEMPGTAVVRVTNTQLVRDTRQLRGEVERWRYAFIAAVAAGVAGMALVGVVALRWANAPAAVPPPDEAPHAVMSAAPVAAVPSVATAGSAPSVVAPPPPASAAAVVDPKKPVAPRPKPAGSASAKPVEAPPPPAPAPTAAATSNPNADEVAALKRQVAQLDPRDSKAFDALAARVRKAAEQVPEVRRQRLILSDIAAAERSYDVEPLADAVRKLAQ